MYAHNGSTTSRADSLRAALSHAPRSIARSLPLSNPQAGPTTDALCLPSLVTAKTVFGGNSRLAG
eukprot:373100-Lingulodinium_polyedra.AAC.1